MISQKQKHLVANDDSIVTKVYNPDSGKFFVLKEHREQEYEGKN